MITTRWWSEITIPAIALACVQFPIYGFLLGAAVRKEKRTWGLTVLVLHAAALAILFIWPASSFS